MSTYEIQFMNSKTGERRTVSVEISADEKAVCKTQDNPDLYAQAYALSRAYKKVLPSDFRHINGSVRAVPLKSGANK